MIKRVLVIFVFFGLLVSCAPAVPPTPPTATPSPAPGATRPPTLASTSTSTPAPTSEPALARVAQTGGSINGITLVGELACVGMGPRVAVIDVRQAESPRLISQSEPLPGLVSQLITVSGGSTARLLVSAGKYLVLMDASDPENVRPLQQVELGGAITAMLWDDGANVLYAGGSIYQHPGSLGYAGFVSALELGPATDLEWITTVSMPGKIISLALGQGSLFAGTEGEEGGLYHIRVNTPGDLSAPRLVLASTREDPLYSASLRVIGDRLYLGYRSVDAYDVANPDQPVRVWRVNASIVVKSFQVSGEQLIVFGWTITNELRLDTLTPPEPIQGAPTGVIASVTAMRNADFLVAWDDLEIYDAADAQTPRLVGSFRAPLTNAIDAAAGDGAVFVVDGGPEGGKDGASLLGFSLPDLERPGQAAIEFPGGQGWHDSDGIVRAGDRLYLATAGELWAYAIDAAKASLPGRVDVGDEPVKAIAAVGPEGRSLLITAQSTQDYFIVLKVFDLTDPGKPILVGDPLTLDQGSSVRMAWNGSALYLLLERSYFSPRSDRLYVIAYDRDALEVKQSVEIGEYTHSLAVDQRVILLVGSSLSMSESFAMVIDAGTLEIMSRLTLPENGLGVALVADTGLVVVGGRDGSAAQLLAFDLRDSAHPRPVDALDIAPSENPAVPILVSGSRVILANGSGGVEVLETRP